MAHAPVVFGMFGIGLMELILIGVAVVVLCSVVVAGLVVAVRVVRYFSSPR